MDSGNLWYMICSGLKHAVHPVWSIKCLLSFNQFYREWLEQVTIFLSVGKGRVKEPVE